MVWEVGRYEHVARQLLPAAQLAVDRLEPIAGEFVVDLGCGTGNAALLATAEGARVLGVDPTPRLLDVARSAAANRGIGVQFVLGDATAIPVDDSSVDAIVSVFALIFVSDPSAAAVEMARVLTDRGRIVLTAWIPGGPIGPLVRLRQELIAEVTGSEAPRPGLAWHDPAALDELFAHHGFTVEVEPAELSFRGDNALDCLEADLEYTPQWVAARSILEPAGRWTELRNAAEQVYVEANEDPPSFQLTSHYVVATNRRAPTS